MGYIYARIIHRGAKSFSDVPERYRDVTRVAYMELFGEELS